MSRLSRAMRGARRAWPLMLRGWERWQNLSPAEKARYKRQARAYADRGRKALEQRRRKS